MTDLAGASWSPNALHILVGAGGLLALAGVPGLLLDRRSPWGQRIANGLILAACSVGLVGAFLMLRATHELRLDLPSPFPGLRSVLGVDALSAWFAVPVLVVGGLGSIFATAYWPARRHPHNGRRLHFCYGLLLASLVFILLARDGTSFLIAWEVMALTNFFLVTIEENDVEVRRAGWLYLLYSHVTILGLFAFFMLQHQVTGALGFERIAAAAPTGARNAIFLLALVAFGIKAGAMPLHSWLPSAHASAPSHVSAVMSGVVIKMGIYGLVRTTGLFDDLPLAWGITVLALGAVAAFFGVVFALSQHDLKRLLAYHSIENIGIILLGLGLAMVGRSLGRPDWVVLGMAGCLFHVWNHALFKSLLFFGAGSLVHATGSRDLERMGGLARRMPATAMLFGIGALAICGLPPFNGFVSELLVYLGLVRAASSAPLARWLRWPRYRPVRRRWLRRRRGPGWRSRRRSWRRPGPLRWPASSRWWGSSFSARRARRRRGRRTSRRRRCSGRWRFWPPSARCSVSRPEWSRRRSSGRRRCGRGRRSPVLPWPCWRRSAG